MFTEKILPILLFFLFLGIVPIIRLIRIEYRRWKNSRCDEIKISAQVTDKRIDGAKIYYATFLTATGDSIEFDLGRSSYGALEKGMRGTLTYQGKNFLSFKSV